MERLMIVACDLCANRPAKPLSFPLTSPLHFPWLEKFFEIQCEEIIEIESDGKLFREEYNIERGRKVKKK